MWQGSQILLAVLAGLIIRLEGQAVLQRLSHTVSSEDLTAAL